MIRHYLYMSPIRNDILATKKNLFLYLYIIFYDVLKLSQFISTIVKMWMRDYNTNLKISAQNLLCR